jgi:hypothetical protein
MYCGEIDNKYISLAWKLGLHPLVLLLVSKSRYQIDHYTTRRTITGNERFSYAIYIYCGETDHKYISLALELGLHPSTLACLSRITSNSSKQIIICISFI